MRGLTVGAKYHNTKACTFTKYIATAAQEDEDEVLLREKGDDDEDEGVISDYESEADMLEMVLKKLEKELL